MKKKLATILTLCIALPVLASAHNAPISRYEAQKGCEKQEVLWDKIEATKHKEFPKFAKFGLFQLVGMGLQALRTKGNRHSDFSPPKWKKYLHRRGSVAKVKFIPTENSRYTGIFNGADCGLLRLSLTYKPTKKRSFATGLALKVLRDGTPSANVSALYKLDGQGSDYDFFKYPLSNIVPLGLTTPLKLVHKLFSRVTDYPEEILLDHLGDVDQFGNKETKIVSPRQLFFVPNKDIKSSSQKHDVRTDFHNIKSGTKVYSVYAVSKEKANFNYLEYKDSDIQKFLSKSVHVGDIVTTSGFVSSEFGDTGLFFRHELRAKKK
jgi:hypothetical protein